MSVLAIHKPVGVSTHRIAIRCSEKWKVPVTHTGTLDPMAEGVVVLLVGRDSKKRQLEFQSGSKTYRFSILFGFSTDSYDGLGMVTRWKGYPPSRFPIARLKKEILRWRGDRRQLIPSFSARVIKGKPMFWWAREGRIKEVGRSFKKIRIEHSRLLSVRMIEKTALSRKLLRGIGQVDGDFRQEEILKKWKRSLRVHPNRRFVIGRIEMRVSGGTYIRSVAHEIGVALGVPAFALGIKRIESGGISLSECLRFEEALARPASEAPRVRQMGRR